DVSPEKRVPKTQPLRTVRGPVAESERISSLDVLRGFALLGILVMNIQSFAMVGAVYDNPTAYRPPQGANLVVWFLSHLLADQKSDRVPVAFDIETSLFLRLYVWKTSSLMLLGMALFKLGALQARWSRGRYLALVGAGLTVGIPLTLFGVAQDFAKHWDVEYSLYFGEQYNYWGSYLVALGWTGLVMLWCRSSRAPALKERMAAAGRMAFTNYILQTVICTTIFYGSGFGYFERVPRTGQILIVFAVYAAQLAIAPLWLRHFRFGPLEWLWRTLTYGKRQPFRRVASG